MRWGSSSWVAQPPTSGRLMKTMNFHVRGDDVVFRCETCSGELHVDPNAPFMPQLLHISSTHACLSDAHGAEARARPHLHVVPDPREATL